MRARDTVPSIRIVQHLPLNSVNDDKQSIGSHPLIVRLLKGIYLLRPPTPRYSSTWDVSKVTDYLKTLAPLNELNLKSLTLKTVMLCALASAQREQTLCALDLNCMEDSGNSISFRVTERLKTSRPGKSLEVSFSSSDDGLICPVAALKEYISRTAALRVSDNGMLVSKLFLSFIKPYNLISTATVARWIKSVLQSAGIDTSVFKAHSVKRGCYYACLYHRCTNFSDS